MRFRVLLVSAADGRKSELRFSRIRNRDREQAKRPPGLLPRRVLAELALDSLTALRIAIEPPNQQYRRCAGVSAGNRRRFDYRLIARQTNRYLIRAGHRRRNQKN